MKLLLENWRKYLLSEIEIVDDDEQDVPYDYDEEMIKDKEQLEKKHFGFDKEELNDIANNVASLFTKYSRYDPDERKQLNKGLLDLSIKYGKAINHVGSGAFRTVVSIGKDLILKVARDPSYNYMNITDHKLGTDSELEGIFPRVYAYGGNNKLNSKGFDWIVIEKTTTIEDDFEIIPFFPSSYLGSANNYDSNQQQAYVKLIAYCLETYINPNVTMRYDYASTIDTVLEMLKAKAKEMGYQEPANIELNKLAQDFERNSKAFRLIGKILKKYPNGVPSEMVRGGNCGVGYDGRFVIIDSSIF